MPRSKYADSYIWNVVCGQLYGGVYRFRQIDNHEWTVGVRLCLG